MDDILLGSIISLFVLLLFTLSSGLISILGIFIGCATKPYITGGATKTKKISKGKANKKANKISKKKANKKANKIDKDISDNLKQIDKLADVMKFSLKSYTNENIVFDKIEYNIQTYGFTKPPEDEIKRETKYIDIAKKIYKRENGDMNIFNFDYTKQIGAHSDKIDTSIHKEALSQKNIDKYMHYRVLNDDYPSTKTYAWKTPYNIKNITYTPKNHKEYTETMDKIFEYAIIESIRDLNKEESSELDKLIDNFKSGKLIDEKMMINFYDGPSQPSYTCDAYQLKKQRSNILKKLHWGQRKLLLSEIDFFNRIADDIGYDKFKKQKISLIYPGAAHGDHLLIEMEMYPNLILYLWDPARYNPVLYLADFIRRGMDIPYQYNEMHMELAKKYVGRVFINMELSNDIYLKYWTNSTTDNIPKNYITEWGFFTQKSADFYLKYKKDNKDESITLFVSDIRLYTNDKAAKTLIYSLCDKYSHLFAINIVNENQRHRNYVLDMKRQQEWLKMVNASYGLQKFKMKTRLFKNPQEFIYEYDDGEIIFQAWGPVSTTETRLFIKANNKIAYYNIIKYTNKLKTLNNELRTHNMTNIKLSELNINVSDKLNITIGEIWKPFLPPYLIGQDAIFETFIIYDYLKIYKNMDDIVHTDIMLLISDITQTLLDHFDHRDILGYFNAVDAENILNGRENIHSKFVKRLDYNSMNEDRSICNIKSSKNNNFYKNNNFHKKKNQW
jgi:hypothetical protein